MSWRDSVGTLVIIINKLFHFASMRRFNFPQELFTDRRAVAQATRDQGSVFNPVTPYTQDFFDYDYDLNVNPSTSSGGAPVPSGILPEQAVALANSRSRKARLWRKVYYLQYLRELYRRCVVRTKGL